MVRQGVIRQPNAPVPAQILRRVEIAVLNEDAVVGSRCEGVDWRLRELRATLTAGRRGTPARGWGASNAGPAPQAGHGGAGADRVIAALFGGVGASLDVSTLSGGVVQRANAAWGWEATIVGMSDTPQENRGPIVLGARGPGACGRWRPQCELGARVSWSMIMPPKRAWVPVTTGLRCDGGPSRSMTDG